MKKVLFVSQTSFFGGAEIVLCDYLNDSINDIQSYLITTNKDGIRKKYELMLSKSNTKIYSYRSLKQISIRKKPIRALIYLFFTIYHIHKVIKKEQIDILYGNNSVDMLAITLYKKFLNKNIIIIQHIHDILQRKMYLRFIEKYDYLIDAYIVPSKAGKNSFVNYIKNPNKISVVYNGVSIVNNCKNFNKVEFCHKYSIPYNKKIIVFIGQIIHRKRLDLFIDIVKELNKISNRYFGVIIGDSDIENLYFKEQLYRLDNNFKYLGKISRDILMKEIYPAIDFFLLTSDRDPFPTVILEAMGNGAVVISRKVDGVSELISDGIDGILWNYNANISEIIEKIYFIMNDERKIIDIKIKAKEKIKEKYNSLNKVKVINKLINDLYLRKNEK